jgi:hypothetical protein
MLTRPGERDGREPQWCEHLSVSGCVKNVAPQWMTAYTTTVLAFPFATSQLRKVRHPRGTVPYRDGEDWRREEDCAALFVERRRNTSRELSCAER